MTTGARRCQRRDRRRGRPFHAGLASPSLEGRPLREGFGRVQTACRVGGPGVGRMCGFGRCVLRAFHSDVLFGGAWLGEVGWMSCDVRTSVLDRTSFPSGWDEDGARKAPAG